MGASHQGEVIADLHVLEHISRDALMARLVEKHGPYHWGLHSPFASLLRAVVGQQLANSVARTIFARLQEATQLEPERILVLGEEGLRGLGLAYAKGRSLLGIARAESEGYFQNLQEMSDDAVRERLTKLKGVGPWTAQMVLIFSLGRLDVWPTSDLGMLRQAEKLYGLQGRKQVEKLGERFAPYRSAAAHYLWSETDA